MHANDEERPPAVEEEIDVNNIGGFQGKDHAYGNQDQSPQNITCFFDLFIIRLTCSLKETKLT